MPLNLSARHIPALLVASSMTFGGMWPMFNARRAMLEFGLPALVADTPQAAPVMIIDGARTTIIGLLVFMFYSRGQMELVDTLMAVTGAYAGLVDRWVVCSSGRRGTPARLCSAWSAPG